MNNFIQSVSMRVRKTRKVALLPNISTFVLFDETINRITYKVVWHSPSQSLTVT